MCPYIFVECLAVDNLEQESSASQEMVGQNSPCCPPLTKMLIGKVNVSNSQGLFILSGSK